MYMDTVSFVYCKACVCVCVSGVMMSVHSHEEWRTHEWAAVDLPFIPVVELIKLES